jgi:hypothetical protein
MGWTGAKEGAGVLEGKEAVPPAIAAPHLGQKRAVSSTCAPQLVQKAIQNESY